MRFSKALATGLLFVFATAVHAEGRSLFLKTGEEKGYGKRDRVLITGSQNVAPSQLHEVYGARVDAGFDYSQGKLNNKTSNYSEKLTQPTATAHAYWSGDIVVFGLGGAYTESKASLVGEDATENAKVTKFLPQLAISFTPNITLGAGSDLNWIGVKKQDPDVGAENFNTFYRRESVSLAWHNPKMEFGVLYAAPVTGKAVDQAATAVLPAFSLAKGGDEVQGIARDIYAPSHVTGYGRGNLTDHISILGSLSHVQYDSNVAGAVQALAPYRQEDRVASQLQGVYWFSDRASRVTLTGNYRGATFAPVGTEETTLGYRLVNVYGGALDGVAEVANRTYVGLMVGYTRGERDQTTDGTRVAASEEKTKIGTSLSLNF